MTPREIGRKLAKDSRKAQGLPPTVRDSDTARRIAALLLKRSP